MRSSLIELTSVGTLDVSRRHDTNYFSVANTLHIPPHPRPARSTVCTCSCVRSLLRADEGPPYTLPWKHLDVYTTKIATLLPFDFSSTHAPEEKQNAHGAKRFTTK